MTSSGALTAPLFGIVESEAIFERGRGPRWP
jgi:hypothetical protein